MSIIAKEEFEHSASRISSFVANTPLTQLEGHSNVYLKQESRQVTGSFKWRGVLYAVFTAFDELLQLHDIDCDKPFYMVTQSTGNHGIAAIRAIMVVKQHFMEKYPEKRDVLKLVCPGIFANRSIQDNKLKKMHHELSQYPKNDPGFVDNTTENYAEALISRVDFLKMNQGIYLSHGGKDIMTGYGSLAHEIHRQVPNDKSITLITAVGAGGPVGIGACLSLLRPDTKVILAQTKEFDAFVRSMQTGKLEENDCDQPTGVSDGIAVDKPELFAFETAQRLGVEAISVETAKAKAVCDRTGLGGSSGIALAALESANISTDVIVVLDCEGNG
jgi:threonine dehydratase